MGWKSPRRTLKVGESAPGFELTETGGPSRSLDELLSKGPTVLAFFKITCPTCQLTLPYLDRLSANEKLQFVAISQDGRRGTEEFRQEYGVGFTTLLDPADSGYEVSNAYGISIVPTIFVIETDGTISAKFDGFSKRDLEALGERAGTAPFGPGDYVPEWKAG